jgi:hypothetical protein
MLAIRKPLLCLLAALSVAIVAGASASEPAKAAPASKLSFGGFEYVHRWSKQGQNEFTPPNQPDLKAWKDMVTIVVNDSVTNGDQLADLANGVAGNYSQVGQIVRTDSKARGVGYEAEHFIAAMLHGPGLTEAVFARVMMVEGKGVVVVYSHRDYGQHSSVTIGTWMDRNGEATERALRSWTGLPKLAQLRALPQSKGG